MRRGHFRADLLAQLLGLGVQIDVDLAHAGAGRDVDHLLRVVGGAAEAGRQHERAAVVDVGVVLPGEADAAVHLDAVLGAVLRGDGRQCGGDRGGELESGFFRDVFAAASSMARAASHTAAVARSVSAIISAHLCLMAWNWPIGLPNCSRILAYADAVSVRPARDADRLGGQQGRHQRPRECAAQVAQHAVVADLDGVGPHVGQRPQRVDALDGLDLQLVGVEHHPLFAAVDRDRKHQHRRLRRRGHRPHLAADDEAVALPGGGQPGVDGVGGDHRRRTPGR